ncbi:MAG: bifunctional phosphopantothenoylcysteine decarboxylase/phosphopantothenate--cysteine ligase CoaBC [Saprospiraceae bacterium]|nr:bifunctional phosphopantothenoylcysteine decarboxylase/phosphopantothenate--cysteine ligase CoaBC [Saprospiraceae bacterium]
MLPGKKILLGICGSIAAYKAAFLCRGLIKEGCEVRVIMTDSATTFISPLTLSTLSKHPVLTSLSQDGQWRNHIELGLWADLLLIAPITAHTLAKMATGLCDNLLTATYLSARCPTMVAPAMDVDMWNHHTTQHNIDHLRRNGIGIIAVQEGELASGLEGPGRMAEPDDIVREVKLSLNKESDLEGLTILVTAGPTYEDIDPVRYIGNRSSGKMGVAIAQALLQRGAEVQLVLGPSTVSVEPHERLSCVSVRSAAQMAVAARKAWNEADVAILAAAVADFRPKEMVAEKIKKSSGGLQIPLEATEDIAMSLAKSKRPDQSIIGFALESDRGLENAVTKLKRKNFDLIVLNSLRDEGAGFQHDTNKVTFIGPDGEKKRFALKSKTEVAMDIVDQLVELRNTKK